MADAWDEIYATHARDALGWYERIPSTLEDVLRVAPSTDCSIIDVGAGESSLAEQLHMRGFHDVTLLDISEQALNDVACRLDRPVVTIVADVRAFHGDRRWDVWHDRATFHFLTSDDDRKRYVDSLDRSLADDGRVVMAVFAHDGPDRCAGRPVDRYDAQSLGGVLGERFVCVGAREHRPDPGPGDRRPYVIATFKRQRSLERG